MPKTRRLPPPPPGDTGWRRTGATAYQRSITTRATQLIARVTLAQKEVWSASVVLLADGQRLVGLDERRNTVDVAQRECDVLINRAIEEMRNA